MLRIVNLEVVLRNDNCIFMIKVIVFNSAHREAVDPSTTEYLVDAIQPFGYSVNEVEDFTTGEMSMKTNFFQRLVVVPCSSMFDSCRMS